MKTHRLPHSELLKYNWSGKWNRLRHCTDWLMWALLASYLAFGVFCYLQFKEWEAALKTASPDTQLLAKMMKGIAFMLIVFTVTGRRK